VDGDPTDFVIHDLDLTGVEPRSNLQTELLEERAKAPFHDVVVDREAHPLLCALNGKLDEIRELRLIERDLQSGVRIEVRRGR
jgi:hypothetical protein